MSYMMTVVAAAMLAAIVKELAGSGAMGTMVRFLAGLFVAVTVLSPLVKLELPDVQGWVESFQYEGDSAAGEGEEMAKEMKRSLIKEQLEAYILDKASVFGITLQVEVALDDDDVPAAVTLWGSISPAARESLSGMIQTDLGIKEEAQHWME